MDSTADVPCRTREPLYHPTQLQMGELGLREGRGLPRPEERGAGEASMPSRTPTLSGVAGQEPCFSWLLPYLPQVNGFILSTWGFPGFQVRAGWLQERGGRAVPQAPRGAAQSSHLSSLFKHGVRAAHQLPEQWGHDLIVAISAPTVHSFAQLSP